MQIEPSTKIWLNFGTKFVLPVNPSNIEVNTNVPQDSFNILAKGQVTVPQFPDLMTFKFKSFFPGQIEPFVSSEAYTPDYYIGQIENAMNNATVGRFTMNRPSGANIDCKCIVKSFKVTDNGGEPNDIYYQIELIEYKSYKPEKIVVKTAKKATIQKVERPKSTVKAVMCVGAKVLANGVYCYDSYGSKPHGTANNLMTEVKRIVPGREYPILIGSYGWTKESNLIIKG